MSNKSGTFSRYDTTFTTHNNQFSSAVDSNHSDHSKFNSSSSHEFQNDDSSKRDYKKNYFNNTRNEKPRYSKQGDTLVIMAIIINKAKEIGMSAMDLKSPEMILTQFSDNTTFVNTCNMITFYDPVEILIPTTMSDSKLVKTIKKHFSLTTITFVARHYFNESQGIINIRRLVIPENNTVDLESSKRYLSVSAAAALLKYVEYVQSITFANESLKIVYKACEGFLMIDFKSIANLEIVDNLRDGENSYSLFKSMNYTKTPMGARLLKQSLLQPLDDIHTIETRLNCVSELLEQEELFFGVSNSLSQLSFIDLDHLLTQFVQCPRFSTTRSAQMKISNILKLKESLKLLSNLSKAMEPSENALFIAICNNMRLPVLTTLTDEIDRVVDEDITFAKNKQQLLHHQCFAVKTGINGLLDVARRQYAETIEEMHNMVSQYKDEFQIPSLKLQYNSKRGYYLSVNVSTTLDRMFIKRVRKGKRIICSTKELDSFNIRIRDIIEEIMLLTDRIIEDLVSYIRRELGTLYKISESIALLDLLFSFASLVSVNDEYVRPEFSVSGPIAVKQGRHPVLDKQPGKNYIPNDTYLSDAANFQIITGPNMAGKSTYLRQLGHLVVMAQVGCFVPAKFLSLRIVDKLFTRMGNEDNLEANASSFMVEMREMAFIIQNATDHSLILVDELGRGTSNVEGCSIAWSIAEHLLGSKAYTLFVTHYLQLTDLEKIYPTVKNYHLMVTASESWKLDFIYSLSEGSTTQDRYGMKMARMIGLPDSIMSHADHILHSIEKRERDSIQGIRSREAMRHRNCFEIAHRIFSLKNSTLPEPEMKEYLIHLKQEYLKLKSRFDDETDNPALMREEELNLNHDDETSFNDKNQIINPSESNENDEIRSNSNYTNSFESNNNNNTNNNENKDNNDKTDHNSNRIHQFENEEKEFHFQDIDKEDEDLLDLL